MSKRLLLITALCAAVAGCGGSNDASTTSAHTTTPSTSSTSTTTVIAPITVTVFRVRDGHLVADVARVQGTRAVAAASLTALGLAAPVSIADGTATVVRDDATPEQVAQIVYTLTQYPSIQRVDVAGKTGLTRSDVAQFVPPHRGEGRSQGRCSPPARGTTSSPPTPHPRWTARRSTSRTYR
jgi:hypothetical protein